MAQAFEREPQIGRDGARAGLPTVDGVGRDAQRTGEFDLAQVQRVPGGDEFCRRHAMGGKPTRARRRLRATCGSAASACSMAAISSVVIWLVRPAACERRMFRTVRAFMTPSLASCSSLAKFVMSTLYTAGVWVSTIGVA